MLERKLAVVCPEASSQRLKLGLIEEVRLVAGRVALLETCVELGLEKRSRSVHLRLASLHRTLGQLFHSFESGRQEGGESFAPEAAGNLLGNRKQKKKTDVLFIVWMAFD